MSNANPQEAVQRMANAMQALAAQIGEVEDFDKESDRARAQLEVVKHNLSVLKHEFAEKDAVLKRMERLIVEKDREHDKLCAEIKAATAQRDRIVAELQALRQKHFGG